MPSFRSAYLYLEQQPFLSCNEVSSNATPLILCAEFHVSSHICIPRDSSLLSSGSGFCVLLHMVQGALSENTPVVKFNLASYFQSSSNYSLWPFSHFCLG